MTPAIAQLKQQKIAYRLLSYEHQHSAESFGLEAAELLNLPPTQVFKTLVIQTPEKKLAVGIVPVSGSLNLKSMALALGVKKVAMADKAHVQNTTGYVLGGVSPLGQKKRLPTVIDESAFAYQEIYVSAGKRGLDLALSPNDLATLCSAKRANIGTES